MNQIQIRVVFDRKKTATNMKAALVQLEVTHQSKRRFISTGVKVMKGQFKCGRVSGRPDAQELNSQINQLISEVNAVVDSCNQKRINFSLAFLDGVTSGYRSELSFVEYCWKRLEEKPLADGTKKQHAKVLRFLQTEYTKLADFSDLTLPNIVRLDEYLRKRTIKDGQKMCSASVYTYHKVIRLYINDAINDGIISDSPYTHFRCDKGKSKCRVALSLDEVRVMEAYVPRTAFEEKIRDLFIVQCYTGLAYADLMATDFTKLQAVGDDLVLIDDRQKSGQRFILFVLPAVRRILLRYDFHLPHLAYDVYNRNLKALALAAGIQKTVTTHIGRHTFATTIALSSGIPIEVVSRMLGHTNIQTTQIYAKILPAQVLDGFAKIKRHIAQ
jgi:integrase